MAFGPVDDLFEDGFGQHTLYLRPAAKQRITLPCGDGAGERGVVKIDGFSPHLHRGADSRRGEMVDRQVTTDALLVRLQMRGEHLAGRQLHVVGHRPGRVHAVHDDTVKGGAHVFGDHDGHRALVSDLKRVIHLSSMVRPQMGTTIAGMALLGVFGIAAGLWLAGGVWMLLRRAARPPAGAAAHALARGLPIDMESAELQGSVWMLRTADGLDLPVWDIQGGGEGPVTILMHDWGEAPLTMLPRASALIESTERIVIPTMRGHDGGPGRNSLGSREAADLGCLLDVLGVEGCAIEGRGLGAAAARSVQGDPRVAESRLEDPWLDGRDGLRRILRGWGFPAWPIAHVAAVACRVSGGASFR